MLQSTQIDRVYETAVGTTENVKGGNEQIREVRIHEKTVLIAYWAMFYPHPSLPTEGVGIRDGESGVVGVIPRG